MDRVYAEGGGANVRTFRGSEAPQAIACPASVHPEPGEVLIDSANVAGTVGTVTHLISEQIVLTGKVPADWKSTARSYGLDEKEITDVGFLVYAAKAFWDEYKHAFVSPQTELALSKEIPVGASHEHVRLTCHIDVADIQIDEAIVLDWKSTRLDVDYSAQLLFYAWVLCLVNPEIQRVTTMAVYLRDRTANIQQWTRQQIDAFTDRFIREVINWDGRTYRPGAQCGYCRRFANCPAQQAMIVQTGNALAETEFALPVEPDAVIYLYERVGALSKRIEQFKKAVRARVEQSGGILSGCDKRLAFISQNRDTIDARKAWPILSRVLSEDELADCMAVNKGDMLKAVAEQAPRGQKGKAKDAIMEELRNAGAVTTKDVKPLRLLQGAVKETEIGE